LSKTTWTTLPAGLGTVERLNLALLVDREDDGVARRIDVEPDHVLDLGGEGRILRQFELAPTVRHEAGLAPNGVHLGPRHAGRLGHRPHRPMRATVRRRLFLRAADDFGDLGRIQLRDARRPRLVAQEPIDARLDIALLPTPDRRLAEPRPPLDLRRADPIAGQQHHLRPPHVLLRAVPVGDDRCQTRTIRRTHEKTEVPSHSHSLAPAEPKGNLMSETIH
jgi:hypothetical protein